MPILKIQTNEEIADQKSFRQEASKMIADLLQKPVDYIMIILEEADMLFANDDAPCVYAELKSIGLPEDRTTEFSEKICSFFENQLSIPKNRVYIEFTSTERHMLGWNGKTFLKP